METKCGNELLNLVKIKLGFDIVFVINSLGKKGGLAMLWKVESGIEIVNYSNNHTYHQISKQHSDSRWFLMGFYSHFVTSTRKET